LAVLAPRLKGTALAGAAAGLPEHTVDASEQTPVIAPQTPALQTAVRLPEVSV
jgi:hypothetical protein